MRVRPGERLVLKTAGLSFPAGDLPESQPYDGLGIFVNVGYPRGGLGHLDAQFFLQLANQGLLYGFPRLYLSTGEFPPFWPGLAFRTLTQQHPAFGIENDPYRDVDKRFRHNVPPSREQTGGRRGPSGSLVPKPTAALRCAMLQWIPVSSPACAASSARYRGSRPA